MPNEIKWEPYIYRLDPNDEEDVEDEEDDDEDDDDEYEEYEDKDELRDLIKSASKAKVVNTPFGMFQVDDKLNPFRQFDFWMGHTNFQLTKNVISIIENISGIEVLIPLTRYRFITAVGKMFEFAKIRVKMEKVLCNKHYNLETLQQNEYNTNIDSILAFKNDLKMKHKIWSIYIYPNGRMTFTTTPEGVAQSYELKKLSSGILITSYDEA